MNIVVIGGTGFMGPYVVRSLARQGHTVTVLHRGQTEHPLALSVNHIHHPALRIGERSRLPSLRSELAEADPDVILDMIAVTAQCAWHGVETFRGLAPRVVVISSADVYRVYAQLNKTEAAPVDPNPCTESAPLRTKFYPYRADDPPPIDSPRRWTFDYDKILVEQVYRSQPSFQTTVLRLPMVYGIGDFQHRFYPYLKRMDDHRPAILFSEPAAAWRGTRGYMENVAHAISLAVTTPAAAGKTYNVADDPTVTEREWVERFATITGWKGRIVIVPADQLPEDLRGNEVDYSQHLITDSTLIRTELGYQEPVNWQTALQRTIEWERTHAPETVDPAMFDYATEDAALEKLGR
jgi:nucleoside-diphosphate-sugar epimerase